MRSKKALDEQLKVKTCELANICYKIFKWLKTNIYPLLSPMLNRWWDGTRQWKPPCGAPDHKPARRQRGAHWAAWYRLLWGKPERDSRATWPTTDSTRWAGRWAGNRQPYPCHLWAAWPQRSERLAQAILRWPRRPGKYGQGDQVPHRHQVRHQAVEIGRDRKKTERWKTDNRKNTEI